MNNNRIVSVGSLLLDIGIKCGETDSDLWNMLHGQKVEFNAPATYELIDEGKQVVVDFSQAKDQKIAGIGKRTFSLIGEITTAAGGGASNAIIGIRKMTRNKPELSCQLIAKIGGKCGVPDEDGRALLAHLQNAGIETDLILYNNAATGRSLVLSIEHNGKRDVIYLIYRGAAANLKAEELHGLNMDGVYGGIVANTNSPENTLNVIQWLSGNKRRVVYISSKKDIEFMRNGNDEFFKGFENVIMTVNEKEFSELGDDGLAKKQVIENFAHTIISRGTKGINVYDGDLNFTHYDIAPDRPEFPADQINPNGAGDALSASLAAQYVLNNEFDKCTIELSLCVAACVCMRTSTTSGVPVFKKAEDSAGFIRKWRGKDVFDLTEWEIS